MRRQLVCVLLLLTCCNPSEEQPSTAPAPEPAPDTISESTPPTHASSSPPWSQPVAERGHPGEIDCVYLQPLGDVSEQTTEIVREALATTYGVELRTGPRRDLPTDAFYQPRKRYRAEILLDHLDTWLPADCDRIVGITRKDISTTKDKYDDWGILGLGRVPGNSCVVSSFRVRKKLAEVSADERLARVAIHELGHTLGLPHCPTEACLMADAQGSVVTIDTETHLCERCLRAIRWQGDPPPHRPSPD